METTENDTRDDENNTGNIILKGKAASDLEEENLAKNKSSPQNKETQQMSLSNEVDIALISQDGTQIGEKPKFLGDGYEESGPLLENGFHAPETTPTNIVSNSDSEQSRKKEKTKKTDKQTEVSGNANLLDIGIQQRIF